VRLILVFFVCLFTGFSSQSLAYREVDLSLQQQKYSHIIIRLNKYTESQLAQLMHLLSLYSTKIPEHYFNSETRHLTIYYTSEIKLDDIFELVLKHITDIDKVSGTEL